MGSVVSSAANGVGTLVGNVVSAPFKVLFGASCESVCSGTWDLPCFIEHVCISSLLRLFVVIIVTYIVLLFGYVLCKLGIVKCVAKNAFKMVWKPCSACCGALGLLWQKVRDTKRVHRGRRGRRERDVELGQPSSSTTRDGTGSSSSSSSSDDDYDGDHRRGAAAGSRSTRRSLPSSSLSVRERKKDRIRQSLRLKRVSSKVERAARVSQGISGRQHRHSTSTGPKRTEVPPSLSSRRELGMARRRVGTSMRTAAH
ncbi:hypothetical protein PAHAL_4G072800 [Panicum hallii]|uniref:Uncharacterized protein n=1 Tax=Panicum hallii TaxID=206008 RepID=A0A2S3HHQ4_9POAL|nr:uncharacterized protein LOC112890997 [Panicum hallii]XP_025813677.1 uncharacterized protein LOC112890997 [Panicum hallii]PAN23170.1 hypothetical protein PAHAL_4G072800 [Panicum hallii]